MNIFYVHDDPCEAAQMLCDIHTSSQPKESVQMLSTISLLLGGVAPPKLNGEPYRIAHPKHPCTIWASQSWDNWRWLYDHGVALCAQYRLRYGKQHPAEGALQFIWNNSLCPSNRGFTPPAQAMPDKYKDPNPVVAYRAFYRGEKVWQKRKDHKFVRLARWERGTPAPEWWHS